MIVQLKRLQITEIEMSRGEFMLFSKPLPEKFEDGESKVRRAGIQCVSYYTATIKDDTGSRQRSPFRRAAGVTQHHRRCHGRHPEADRRADVRAKA